jgi:hypothetical protein
MAARQFLILGTLLLLSVTAGCGDGLASVSGTITLDGQPVAGGGDKYATVSFCKEDGGGAPAIGILDSSGRYTLNTGARNGVEPGKYLVGVAVKKISPPATPNDMPQATLITPRKYASASQSGFTAEVQPGRNNFDFALSSKSNDGKSVRN